SVDPELIAAEAGTIAPSTSAEPDELGTRIAAAEGCAGRGDWQCAANFYADALALAPGDTGLVGSLYEAYLALGQQEQSAGRLESARSAFAGAAATDPTRADAPAALDRLAPYARILTIDRFD